ncbi:hypothetical protein OROMI_001434 [Orobanche minor]
MSFNALQFSVITSHNHIRFSPLKPYISLSTTNLLVIMLILVAFQAFLLFLLLLLPTVSSLGNISELLNVKESIAATKLNPVSSYEYIDSDHSIGERPFGYDSIVKLRLVHRDELSMSWKDDHRARFEARMKRDVRRVASLIARLSSYKTEVVFGADQGTAEYLVRIGVGSPAVDQYMVVDTGSDLVWVQCKPCRRCYYQSDQIFDPKGSHSFSNVSCGSRVCEWVKNPSCDAGRCGYKVDYEDGSDAQGTMALETLTIGGTPVINVAIGCGHTNRGTFIGASGVFGLGGGSMSFASQLGGAFTYCLVSRGATSHGWLAFGSSLFPVGAAWAPLLHNMRAPSLYYIGLSGLGVGGARLPIPEDTFRLTEKGHGGTIMDTGTVVTRLPTAAYEALRGAFRRRTANLPRASGVPLFDTCYDLSKFSTVRVPTVSFFFSDGPVLNLAAGNFLIPVDGRGTFCFAFAPSPKKLTIIGNIQQEGIQISVDASNGHIGFGPNVC